MTGALGGSLGAKALAVSQSALEESQRGVHMGPVFTVEPTELYYPTENVLQAAKRPQIRFSCVKMDYPEGKSAIMSRKGVYFPCPANIAFGDAANLSSIDLGVLGAAGSLIANGGKGAQDSVVTGVEAAFDAIGKSILGGLDATLGGAASKAQAIKKTVPNPFTNTTFQGNNVRNFTFNFKMVATSQQEAAMIKNINDFFRVNMYGGDGKEHESGLIDTYLSYPPVWEIDFLQSVGQHEAVLNPYLPKIFSCYLGGFNSTFNTTSATWFHDGAPLEVDISLTFQETRALTARDIRGLQSLTGNYRDAGSGQVSDNNMALRGIGVGGKAIGAPIGSKVNFDTAGKEFTTADGVTYTTFSDKETKEINVLGDTEAGKLRNARDGTANFQQSYNPGVSDIRLKENIYEVDVSPSGIKIYEFKYIDGVDRYRGVMAQDLLEIDSKHPAVSTDSKGFYVVDYGLLDVNMEKIT